MESHALSRNRSIEDVEPLGCRVVVVVNMTDPKYDFAFHEVEAVKHLGVELYGKAIPRSKVMREAELMGVPAWEVPFGTTTHAVKLLMGFCEWVSLGAPDDDSTYGFSESEDKRLRRYSL